MHGKIIHTPAQHPLQRSFLQVVPPDQAKQIRCHTCPVWKHPLVAGLANKAWHNKNITGNLKITTHRVTYLTWNFYQRTDDDILTWPLHSFNWLNYYLCQQKSQSRTGEEIYDCSITFTNLREFQNFTDSECTRRIGAVKQSRWSSFRVKL